MSGASSKCSSGFGEVTFDRVNVQAIFCLSEQMRKFQMQQNPTIFSMETEVLDSVSLSVKAEPDSLERRIHLPEVRSKQILSSDVPSFA